MMTLRLWLWALLAAAVPAVRPIDAAEPTGADLDSLRQLNRAFVELARKVSPSVVVINVVQNESPAGLQDAEDEEQTDNMPPGFWKEFHKQFKRLPVEKTIGQGSGIVVRENGYILTNGHVIEDAESISVQMQDGKTYKANVRGIDPQSDVAIIKIDAKGLPAAVLGDSDRTQVGELAGGNWRAIRIRLQCDLRSYQCQGPFEPDR
jgi:serine protease Do